MKSNTFYNKLLNSLIKKGKKNKAKKILELFSENIRDHYEGVIYNLFIQLFENLSTGVETKNVKVKGSRHLVPFFIPPHRRTYLVIKWFITSSRKNLERVSMEKKMITEFVNVLQEDSNSFALESKRMNNLQAIENRSNLHYRW